MQKPGWIRLLLLASLTICKIPGVIAQEDTTQYSPEDWAQLATLPNFDEGVWNFNVTFLISGEMKVERPQLRDDAQLIEMTSESCIPIGVPSVMRKPYPFEFVYEPGRILMLMEYDGMVRRIFTDGRGHPEDPDLTYGGHSIGHWEGETLVVDTVGFLPTVVAAGNAMANGPMHIIERMYLAGPDTLRIDTRVEAPDALAEPYSFSTDYERHRDWTVQEYFCIQNPRSLMSEEGEWVPDLTPPQ